MNNKQHSFLSPGKSFWILLLLFFAITLALFAVINVVFFVFSNTASISWSPSAEALGALLGFPVSLAGSVVAIILAQRAVDISHRQEQQEIIKNLEKLTDTIFTEYWKISDSLRSFIHASSDIIIKFQIYPFYIFFHLSQIPLDRLPPRRYFWWYVRTV